MANYLYSCTGLSVLSAIMALIIAYVLNVIDYLFTAYWVNIYGSEIEANPLMRWAFEHNIGWLVKIFAVSVPFAVIGYFIHKCPRTAWAAYVLLTVYAMIVLYHGFLFFMF